MSELTNSEYFAQRAAQARELSKTATDPRAAEAHLEMALRYDELSIDFKTRRSTPHIGLDLGDRAPA